MSSVSHTVHGPSETKLHSKNMASVHPIKQCNLSYSIKGKGFSFNRNYFNFVVSLKQNISSLDIGHSKNYISYLKCFRIALCMQKML